MTISQCCGESTKMEYRPDLPHVYDDEYDLRVPVYIYTKCGKITELQSIEDKGDRPEQAGL